MDKHTKIELDHNKYDDAKASKHRLTALNSINIRVIDDHNCKCLILSKYHHEIATPINKLRHNVLQNRLLKNHLPDQSFPPGCSRPHRNHHCYDGGCDHQTCGCLSPATWEVRRKFVVVDARSRTVQRDNTASSGSDCSCRLLDDSVLLVRI